MTTQVKGYWLIEGYSGTHLIYKTEIPVNCMTEYQLTVALKCLVSKAGLNCDEIVRACAKKGTKISNSVLEVLRDGPKPIFSCGDDPHFSARVISKSLNGKDKKA